MSSQGRLDLPPELIVHIASYATASSLVKLEELSKSGQQLVTQADTICWRHHCLSMSGISTKNSLALADFVAQMKDRCLDNTYWNDTITWKMAFRRLKTLHTNWSMSSTPKTRVEIVGFARVDPTRSALPVPKLRSLTSSRILHVPYANLNASYVWRARLDTARDANFVLTTWHTGGLRVVDADVAGQGSVLWELPKWSVRPYAHLEYKRGVACWDGEAGVEVWKRWKIVLGEAGQDEPPNKRGEFVRVAILPDVPNTRGFMLNDDLHLTICSSDGRSCTYDLSPKVPVLLYSYDIPQGAAGHLEHNSEIAVYSLGQKGYTIYHKDSSTMLGMIDFSEQSGVLYRTLEEAGQSNFFKVDAQERYPTLAANDDDDDNDADIHQQHRVKPPRKDFVTTELEAGPLQLRGQPHDQMVIEIQPFFQGVWSEEDPSQKKGRSNAIPLQHDLWGAAMVRKLQGGSTILVARSRGGRLLICSDLLGLLTSLQESTEEEANLKVRECVAIIECGGRASRTEFYTGGWLAVDPESRRAAWEIDDLVYIMSLPQKRNTLPKVGSPIWMIPSFYSDEIPMPRMQIPISFMSLHDDVFLSTFLHPAYVLITEPSHSRWETTILKSVRIIHFTPGSMNDEEEEQEDSIHALTNANKALHRRWLITGRRLTEAAEVEGDEWTDEEDGGVE